jgi:hypothetical protein
MPARLRVGSGWVSACILNISSRGLLIRSTGAAEPGNVVELRRGDQVILARVVWRHGSRAGLQAEDQLPVEEILSLTQAPALQLTARTPMPAKRKKPPRSHEDNRQRARVIEFASVAAIAGSLAFGVAAMAQQALARPLALVGAALGG